MVSFGTTIRVRWKFWSVCVTALALLALVISSAAGSVRASADPPIVQSLDLGTLGGAYAEAVDVNESGQVVGNSEIPGGQIAQYHAFSWTAPGGMVDLGTLGGRQSEAVDVSDSGQVVGWSDTSAGVRHAFSWTSVGGMVDLGALYGGSSEAVAVNDTGQVVGSTDTTGGAHHAFLWTAARGAVDLGTLGGRGSLANDINDAGQVVGVSGVPAGSHELDHTFLWTAEAGMADLGTLGGVVSFPVDISETGQVVGDSTTNGISDLKGFSWTPAGGMVDIGPGAPWAVNDRGEVVGGSNAFSWTAAGGRVDLGNPFGDAGPGSDPRYLPHNEAVAVNNEGLVVGTSYPPYGSGWANAWTASGDIVGLGAYDGRGSDAVAVNDRGQIVGEAGGHAMMWTLSVPFATMDASAVITVPAGADNDRFALAATFTLGGAGNGIDPSEEPVTLTLGGTTLRVPAGSFRGSAHAFLFTGNVAEGRLAVVIRPVAGGGYRLDATGIGYDLSSVRLPLSVRLTIGDDTGTTDAKAVIAPPPR
jgi:probable HAF family extracellular repeat protein